jgi:transcriptional regulator with XRE-family HTH domain
MELRRVRNYLGLSQVLVSVATGISISRLSSAENGHQVLNRTERAVLEDFYRTKLKILAEAKRDGAE